MLIAVLALAGCDGGDNPLSDYEGSRPLIIQRITQSHAPDIQWVGGRVAAVGINRGETAALDSTLVWMITAGADDISAPIFMRDVLDEAAVTNAGGTPSDSLEANETYTLWIATQEGIAANLDSTAVDEFSFADSTFTTEYLLNGRSAGGVDVEFRVARDQRLVSDQYTISWTPATQAFRRVAIRNSTVGGFDDLLWHIVQPDDQPDSITSPLILGTAPDNVIVATEWDGFGEGSHTLWAATDEWNGESFSFTTEGYAFFQIFASNFE